MEPKKRVIVGTAGHIDHGKSSLVKILTGIDPDRFAEEKRRGITIDLGFAYLEVENYSFSFVDVPGHEDYVKNMAAGAIGFDICLMVVDINEGVKEQTIEHTNIVHFLGVEYLIVVFTKIDKYSGDFEAKKGEIKKFFEKYSFPNIYFSEFSIFFNKFRDSLIDMLKNVADLFVRKRYYKYFYMNVDRSFTMKGFGTVVTGSVLSGELKLQDTIFLMPADKKIKVKGLSVHGKKVHKVEAGDRAAINISDIDVKDVKRGDILTSIRLKNFDTCYCLLEKFKNNFDFKIKHNGIYNIFVGATSLNVRINLLSELEGKVFVRMKLLDNLYPFIYGEKFLIRIPNPKITVSGGIVLFPQELHANKSTILTFLGSLLKEDRFDPLCNYFESFGKILRDDIYQFFLLEEDDILKRGIAIAYGEYLVSSKLLNHYFERGRSILLEKGYFDIQNDLDRIDPILGKLVVDKLLEFSKEIGFRLVDNRIKKVEDDFEGIVSKVLECMAQDIAMSNQKIISSKLLMDENVVANALKFLSNKGKIKKIDKDGNYILTDLLKKFIKDSVELSKKYGFVDIGNVREVINSPRKILIPLLELLDETNLFKNINNKRYLK